MEATSMGSLAAKVSANAKSEFVPVTEEKLHAFLTSRDGILSASITDYRFLTGGAGASNGTVLFTAELTTSEGSSKRDLVLRFAPGNQLLKQKSYRDEFLTLQALSSTDLPTPRPLWVDDDGSVLGSPGLVMERLRGNSPEAAMFVSGILADADPAQRHAMLLEGVGFHARLRRAAIGADLVPHLTARGAGATAVERELMWWRNEALLASDIDSPYLQYIDRLVRWMIDNEPPLRPATLVHGDAQFANLMFEDGRLTGAIDWELAYLGHAEADLALMVFLNEMHAATLPDLGGVPTAEEMLERFERESGHPVEHWPYFQLFNMVKVLGIQLVVASKHSDFSSMWEFQVGRADALWQAAKDSM